jgi:hypothetical protein
MKRALISIAVLLVALGAVVAARAATSSSAPDRAEVKAWLQDQRRSDRIDIRRWNHSRELLDEEVRADTRTLDRRVLIPVINAPTRAEAITRAEDALQALAAPGPADSASKRLHTTERRITDHAKQALKRHLNRTERFLAEFP